MVHTQTLEGSVVHFKHLFHGAYPEHLKGNANKKQENKYRFSVSVPLLHMPVMVS